MKEDCALVDGLIKPCEALEKATSDYQGHHKKGLSILPISNREFKTVKHYLIVKNGEFQKNGIICNYCPFCGGKVYKADTQVTTATSPDSSQAEPVKNASDAPEPLPRGGQE